MDLDARHSLIVPDKYNELIECKICNRKFIKESILKHEKNCKKVLMTTRKPFNMKAIRCKELNEKLKESDENFYSWGGGFKLKSSLSSDDIDKTPKPTHITCEYCNRNFIYESGVKHIKICEINMKKKKNEVKRTTVTPNTVNKILVSKHMQIDNGNFSKKENLSPKCINNNTIKPPLKSLKTDLNKISSNFNSTIKMPTIGNNNQIKQTTNLKNSSKITLKTSSNTKSEMLLGVNKALNTLQKPIKTGLLSKK